MTEAELRTKEINEAREVAMRDAELFGLLFDELGIWEANNEECSLCGWTGAEEEICPECGAPLRKKRLEEV